MIAPIATKPPAMDIKGSKLRVVADVAAGEVGMLAKVSWMIVAVGEGGAWVLEVDGAVMIVVDE